MAWKSKAVYPFAKLIANRINKQDSNPIHYQRKIFKHLLARAKNTQFGKKYDFESIRSYSEFRKRIPILSYEDLRPFIENIQRGKKDILWPGLPKYFVGTSGTTSGIKYIPLTHESMPYHFASARDATFDYCFRYNLTNIFDGKMIFLSGSPALYKQGIIDTGRLSGIMNREIPSWLRSNQIPTFDTNCIADWEQKIKQIVLESVNENMTMISGITPWIIMYAEYLLDYTNKKTVREIFPNLNLVIHGGVNFGPYREKLERLIGQDAKFMETYPASEGFIAAQSIDNQGLRLNINGGIFFEFIDAHRANDPSKKIPLEDIDLEKNYAIILNNNAGFFSYLLGDTVKFVSKNPFRLIVTGRLSQFISAFGEHVIVSEAENAIQKACTKTGISINEFSVAPNISANPKDKAYHEWFIEFESEDVNISSFAKVLDEEMQKENFQYLDLVKGKVIAPLIIRSIKKNGFRDYMKSIGKLGGQNKVPKLNNNRSHADQLKHYELKNFS